MPVGWSITQIWVKPSGIPQIWGNPQIWEITQNWGNHAQITQNWVLHLFLRVVIYLFTSFKSLVLKLTESHRLRLVFSFFVQGEVELARCRRNDCEGSGSVLWGVPVSSELRAKSNLAASRNVTCCPCRVGRRILPCHSVFITWWRHQMTTSL